MKTDKRYAVKITKRHLDLVAMLNGGGLLHPSVTMGKHYLTFRIDKDRESYDHQIVTERELFQTHDIIGECPLIMRIKK